MYLEIGRVYRLKETMIVANGDDGVVKLSKGTLLKKLGSEIIDRINKVTIFEIDGKVVELDVDADMIAKNLEPAE